MQHPGSIECELNCVICYSDDDDEQPQLLSSFGQLHCLLEAWWSVEAAHRVSNAAGLGPSRSHHHKVHMMLFVAKIVTGNLCTGSRYEAAAPCDECDG